MDRYSHSRTDIHIDGQTDKRMTHSLTDLRQNDNKSEAARWSQPELEPTENPIEKEHNFLTYCAGPTVMNMKVAL